MNRLILLLLALSASSSIPLARQPEAPATLPGEGMYPRPSREVWDHVRTVLQKAGFRVERQDNKNQIIVTQWRSYDFALLPSSETLGLGTRDRVKKLQLHVMVSPEHEPARVAVGSIIELDQWEGARTSTAMGYRIPAIEDWFLDALDAQVGVKHEPMASTFAGRAAQATRLGNTAPACVPPNDGRPAAPVKLSDVRPIFPAQGLRSGEGKVWIQARITEHGSLTHLNVPKPSPGLAHYEASARAAVSLWRFKPPILGSCPVETLFTISVAYTMR